MLSSQIKTIEKDLLTASERALNSNRPTMTSQDITPNSSRPATSLQADIMHVMSPRKEHSREKKKDTPGPETGYISLEDSMNMEQYMKSGMTFSSGLRRPQANFMPLESERNSNLTKHVWSHIAKGVDRSVDSMDSGSKSPPKMADRIKERRAIVRA